ncbi:hypothetical protein R3Q06_32425 [Rhodococcus erythropolis]|uniref:hypothetical protein n=1 Tax=Rhodococcus erythropolis TaxID=1833 RepID=UPI002948E4EC|nr:hypothetical protein [Rhodococcus erythropolis]MDV6278175.1 hypothetical protein [Rhodococcus erythropolis]
MLIGFFRPVLICSLLGEPPVGITDTPTMTLWGLLQGALTVPTEEVTPAALTA